MVLRCRILLPAALGLETLVSYMDTQTEYGLLRAVCVCPSRPLADTEKLPVRTHRPEVVKSPGADEDGESVRQEPKKRISKEKKEKKKDKDKDRKVCLVGVY